MAGPGSRGGRKGPPSVRSRSGILTNAATTGGPPNTMLAAGGAGGGSGAGATPAVIAAQRPQSRAINRPTTQTSRANVGPGMQQLSGGTPTGYTAANFDRPLQTAATDTRLTAPPTADELMGQRYQKAAETYYDPVTGGNTPAYEAMLDAPTYGTPGAMGAPSGGNPWLEELAAMTLDERIQTGLDLGIVDQTQAAALAGGASVNPEAANYMGAAGAAPAAAAPAATIPVGGLEQAYSDMYGDLRDDAQAAYDTSGDFYTTEGILGRGHWSGVEDRANQYYDDRGAAAEGYFGGMRDDQLEYLTGREGREQAQILAMADMRRGNVGQQYQHMTDALNAEELRRGGVYDELEATRGARLDANEAALLGQMQTLEGERLTQEQAMADAMGGRYTSAQGGLDQRRLDAEAALREQGVGPEAYTTAVGAETAALLGSQGLSSQDLQGRLASIAASEATDRSLGATGLFQDARSALADQLFGGRADLAENIAGRRTGLGQQNLQALAGIGTGELGAQQSLANAIAQGQFGANQAYSTGMYDAGEQVAAGRFNAAEAAQQGRYGLGTQTRAGQYQAEQAYNAEVSRIDQMEASGQISRAEAAQAKAEAESKAAQAKAAEDAQFAQIDAQMGLAPGTAQAMSAGGLLGDLYGDLMGSPENEYENMMSWTPQGGTESYFVDPEIILRQQIESAQNAPVAMYPVEINGQIVNMPIGDWPDVQASQEYEALR